jgi:hypothetical protein
MSNKKVVVSETPEAVKNLEFDDVASLSLSDDPDAVDVRDQDVDLELDQGIAIEDLDDEEQIWEGGPTAAMIKQWKSQYGEVYVTSISFDKHIVWRVLNRLEYKQIVKKMENMIQTGELSSAEANMWNEETVSEMCILYPKYNTAALKSEMAGLPSLIAQEVLEASGFVALEVRQL